MQLTEKETLLLKDLKGEEQLCIDKYTKHAQCAKDEQLKTLLEEIASEEQNHLNLLTQIETGTVPTIPQGGEKPEPTFQNVYPIAETPEKKNDCYICTDLLTTEKHASSSYDTSIFEFTDSNVRDVLNHIQKDEQGHGKKLYDYMSANNMYSVS